MVRSIPRINAALQDQQEDYVPTMMELEGKSFNQYVSLIVDLGDILSYFNPKVVENCCLQTHKIKNPSLV